MRSSRVAIAAAAATGLALSLSGCSLFGGENGGELDAMDSPLAQYLNAGYDPNKTDEEWQAEYNEQSKKTEAFVATCMSDLGFEYTPVDNSSTVVYSGQDEWNPDDRQWVSQYGYGAIDYPGRTGADEPVPEGEEYVDPNQDYVASLSESEQQAYYEALYGPQPTEEQMNSGEEIPYDPNNAGCYGDANLEVNGEQPYNDEQWQPLMEAVNEFYTKQYDGTGFEIDKKWSSCMADAGYPDIAKQSDASQKIYDELNVYYESIDPETAGEDAYDFTKSPGLQELQKKEVEMALADLDCREKVNYKQEQLKEQFAAEEIFVQQHKAELEAFKAAQEQKN